MAPPSAHAQPPVLLTHRRPRPRPASPPTTAIAIATATGSRWRTPREHAGRARPRRGPPTASPRSLVRRRHHARRSPRRARPFRHHAAAIPAATPAADRPVPRLARASARTIAPRAWCLTWAPATRTTSCSGAGSALAGRCCALAQIAASAPPARLGPLAAGHNGRCPPARSPRARRPRAPRALAAGDHGRCPPRQPIAVRRQPGPNRHLRLGVNPDLAAR